MKSKPMKAGFRAAQRARCAAAAAALLLALGCTQALAPQPVEPTDATLCSFDGMLLSDFPGPKGQILYEDGAPDFFCDTVELFSAYLQPEEKKRVSAIYTQDMAQTPWDKPRGHWIDARSAFYVIGSRKTGSMGPTIASFAKEADAQAFAREQGGRVLRFDQVKPDMVALDGGVLKDSGT